MRTSGGGTKPLDIKVSVTDDNNVPVTGATVQATASCLLCGPTWTGNLADQGTGDYQSCDVASYSSGTINVSVTATKSGYQPASQSGTAGTGNLCP